MNHNDPKLSDFSTEQLRELFSMVMDRQREIRQDIKSYKITPALERMFADKVAASDRRLESLDEILTQLAGVLDNKDKAEKIASN